MTAEVWVRPYGGYCINCGGGHYTGGTLCPSCQAELNSPPMGPPDSWSRPWRLMLGRSLALTHPTLKAPEVDKKRLVFYAKLMADGKLKGDGEYTGDNGVWGKLDGTSDWENFCRAFVARQGED